MAKKRWIQIEIEQQVTSLFVVRLCQMSAYTTKLLTIEKIYFCDSLQLPGRSAKVDTIGHFDISPDLYLK